MEIEMSLIENSQDYLFDSLDLYNVADEDGNHDPQTSDIENKKKWKSAFIFLVQAIELLLKEGLLRVNPLLMLNDIDSDSKNFNTVAFSKAIKRLQKLSVYQIDIENVLFLIDCANLRNEFIHYKVHIKTPEIKRKYTKLVSCYMALYQEIMGNQVTPSNRKYDRILERISNFDKCLDIFRGREFPRIEIENIKAEIIKSQEFCFYVNSNDKKIPRIKYGLENDILEKKGRDSLIQNKRSTNMDILMRNFHIMTFDSDYEYCTSCRTQKGEYHVQGCDCELCPICNNFIVLCKCELTLYKE